MTTTIRFAVVVAAAVAFSPVAEAQFNRGIMRDSVDVTLFPILTPETLLPTGSFRVDMKNTSSASARIVDELQSGIGRQIAENDARLRVSPQADFVITATLTEWSQRRRTGSKYVSQQRQTGTREKKDSKGNITYEPIYEYGHNEPTVIHEGTASVRLDVRQASTEAQIEDLTARVTIFDETPSRQSPPSDDMIQNSMVDSVIRDTAAKLSPGRHQVRVLMARSDEVERFNDLARDRKWLELKEALERLPAHKDAKKDAYRLHNLGVAHEALAYESRDKATVRAELKEADALMARAVAAKKDEKYFVDSSQRVSSSLRAVEWIAERETLLAAKYPIKPTVRTSRPASPEAFAPPAASPVKVGPGAKPAPPKPPAAANAPVPKPAAAVAKPAKADAPPMTNADVIDLAKAGLEEKLLIATIRESASVNFDLGPAGLRALLAGKVSNPVITAMRERAK